MIAENRHDQIVSEAGKTVEDIPFTPNYESTHKAHVVIASIRHDDVHTEELCTFTFRCMLSAPFMDHNLILQLIE